MFSYKERERERERSSEEEFVLVKIWKQAFGRDGESSEESMQSKLKRFEFIIGIRKHKYTNEKKSKLNEAKVQGITESQNPGRDENLLSRHGFF